MSIHYECETCKWRYYPHCICPETRAVEIHLLKHIIDQAEFTYRSDIINPVRDIVDPILALLEQAQVDE